MPRGGGVSLGLGFGLRVEGLGLGLGLGFYMRAGKEILEAVRRGA